MKLNQIRFVGLGAILVLVLGVAVACKPSRREKATSADEVSKNSEKPNEKLGFLDAVKNPEEWQRNLDDENRSSKKAIETASRWNDQEVENAVRKYAFETPSQNEAVADFRALQSIAAKTHAFLLKILGDPGLRARLLKPTNKDGLPEAPFNRVCQLLENNPPNEAVVLLIPFLDEKSDEIRKSAAMLLGTIGTESVLAPIRKALNDEDEYVRSYALMGLERAIKAKRLEVVCRRELFEDLQKLLIEGKNSDNAARVLVHFDQKRAVEFFLSDALFKPDASALHYVLRILNERGIVVARDRLLGLIEKLSEKELKYPQTYLLGQTLESLGKHQVPEDRKTLEKYLSHKERIVAEGAAMGMLSSHGLEGFQKRIWDVIEKRGIEVLTIPQRRYNAVDIFEGEVHNGGLTQYFFNSSGDDWRAAEAGLEAMGSKERLAILRAALAKFGKEGPSENRDKRMEQLSKIERANEKTFDDLDNQYYKSTENVTVMAMRYVLKNPEAFR